ncbi:putative ribonuclease H-like domain-containing protein [Tanacetum coccineum]
MTAPSTSSTNDVNTAKPTYEVNIISPNVNTANSQVSTASLSDNAVYAFMVENPNGSNLLQQDLEQIHEDDLEAMDLKWQLSLLSMRAKRYYQRTCKKIFINANDTAEYDKSKVECFTCHKMGHLARECRAPRNKEGQFRNQDNTRKQGNNEDTSSKAMLAIDGVGFYWSDMAEEQVQTNMALMAFSDFEVYNDKTCSKTCLKNYETLKKQYDDLIVKLNQTEFTAATYKRGLATVEEQLITYRKNEVLFSEEVAVLKREVACKDYEINVLKNDSKENSDDSLVKEQVPEDTSSFVESPLNVDKETIFLADKKKEFVKPKNHEKLVKKSVRVNYNYTTNKTHLNAQRNMVPRAVLMKTGLKPFNTARTVNTIHPNTTVFSAKPMLRFSKTAQSTLVNTARPKAVKTARPNSAVVNAVRVNQENAVKTSAYWVWRPTKPDSASITLKKHNYIDARGRSKSRMLKAHARTGTLKTIAIDFDDVYFVNELKFNLFSVSQMCDKKNYVLFTDIECLILSPNFKLPDENQILLKIPRKDNMYSFDMKNIVPKESLTCLVAKATLDEYNSLGIELKDASYFDSLSKDVDNGEPKSAADDQKQVEDGLDNENDAKDKSDDDSSPKEVNAAGQHVNTASPDVNTGSFKLNVVDEPEVDLGNITNSYTVPTTPNTRIHKDHLIENVIGDVKSSVQTRRMTKPTSEQGFPRRTFYNSKLQQILDTVDLPNWKRGSDYEEVFAPVARIEAIRLFLAYDSFMGFLVYQMDVKSAFLYRTIEEEVYVTQPLGFKDPDHPDKVYKVGDEAVHKELGDRIERADTTASSLEAEQDSGSGPRCQDTILGDVDAQTRFEITSKLVHDSHLSQEIQALIDNKKLIITKSSIQSDLHLGDAGGTDCLLTATIFEELEHMGLSAKTTAWNEFSSAMASAIICLATNQKFNFSKYIFDAMLGDMSHHKKIYVNPSHTKKIFANMKREGNDFSGRVTPLFATMMVQPNQEEGVDSGIPTDSHQTPITTQPSTSRSQKQSRRKQRKDTAVTQEEPQQDDSVPTPSNNPLISGEDSMQLSELMILCTNLQKQVLDLEKAKDAQAKEIVDLKKRVQKLERKKKSRTIGLKRLRKVGMSRRVKSSKDKDSLGGLDDAEMFDINELHGDEVVVDMPVGEKQEQSAKEREVNTRVEVSAAPTTIEEITLAQTLIQIKSAKPKVVTTATTTTTTTMPKARGKQEEEANIALIESWDNTQAMMEADFELAQRLQIEEQGEITIKERSRLYKHNQLKSKSFEEIQKLFDNEMSRVNTFIPMDSEEVKSKKGTEESSKGTEDEQKSDKSKKAKSSREKAKGIRKKMLGKKRARKEQQQESSKRQRMEDDKETDEHEEVKKLMKLV